ncbi:MAG: hypothetical protein JO275_01465 [Verrucomicrobia bacterium]|nr:hypothetical protein [Verrucomicrobiota bacterium]
MKTGGSRKRLSAMYSPMAFDSFAPGLLSCIALGNSREPPALTWCGPTTRWYEYLVGVRSRAKAAPLQAMGIMRVVIVPNLFRARGRFHSKLTP